MTAYTVGELYRTEATSWPECVRFSFRSGVYELLLFWRSPSADEIAAVRTGGAQFGAALIDDALFVLFRFGALPVSDAAYSWHLVPRKERSIAASLGDQEAIALQVMLIDAGTGVVEAIRLVSLHPAVARTIVAAIQQQARIPWDQRRYDTTIARVYDQPTEDLERLCELWPSGIMTELH